RGDRGEDDVLVTGDPERRDCELAQTHGGRGAEREELLPDRRLPLERRQRVDLLIEEVHRSLLASHARAGGDVDALGLQRLACRRGVLLPGADLRELRPLDRAEVDPARGRGEHQRGDALGPAEREDDPGPATHGLADERHALEAQVIRERFKVVRVGIDARGPRLDARGREAAMGEAHAGEPVREIRDLLPPRHVIAAEPVREDERRPAPHRLVVDRRIGPLNESGLAMMRHTSPFSTSSFRRHGRACPGHPRLLSSVSAHTWMPGTSPGMTRGGALVDRLHSGSPRTRRGWSPTTPMAWRMKRRFSGGTWPTAARPRSRASFTGGTAFENSRLRLSVTAA